MYCNIHLKSCPAGQILYYFQFSTAMFEWCRGQYFSRGFHCHPLQADWYGRRHSKQGEVTFFGIFVHFVSRDIMCWVKYVSKYAQIFRRPDLILMKCEVRFGDILADLNFWNVANEIDKVSALNLTLDGNDLFSGLWHCMRLCAFLDNRLRPNLRKNGVNMLLRFCWKLLSIFGQKHR